MALLIIFYFIFVIASILFTIVVFKFLIFVLSFISQTIQEQTR